MPCNISTIDVEMQIHNNRSRGSLDQYPLSENKMDSLSFNDIAVNNLAGGSINWD